MHRGARLLLSVVVLGGAATLVLLRSPSAPPPSTWQRIVGGFGLADRTSPEWGFGGLDPRGTRTSETWLAPIVGLPGQSPTDGAGLFDRLRTAPVHAGD